MWFVTLLKFKHRPTKKDLAAFDKAQTQAKKEGVKFHGDYYTFGRFDNVIITEARNERPVMKFFLSLQDTVSTETLDAMSQKEGRKLLW